LLVNTREEVTTLRSASHDGNFDEALRASLGSLVPEAADKLSFTGQGTPRPLQENVASNIHYLLREAVLNSANHANANAITVTLNFASSGVQAYVIDDGIGIDADLARAGRTGHWGLVGMRERIRQLDGEIEIVGSRNRGTTVRFTIPASRAYAVSRSIQNVADQAQ
jgi:signal transduction histidine kinase